jgi:hypothetical protein
MVPFFLSSFIAFDFLSPPAALRFFTLLDYTTVADENENELRRQLVLLASTSKLVLASSMYVCMYVGGII